VVVNLSMDDRLFEDVRLAVGPVALTPFRARKAEEALRGMPVDREAIAQALAIASEEAQPRANPVRGSAEYRREMVQVLLRRALERAVASAQG
jgi:carbon-monoxide dehydrogenase medium subunit